MSDATTQAAGNTQATGSAQPGATGAAATGAATTAAATPVAAPAAAAPASAAAASTTQQATDGKPAGDKPAAGSEGDGAAKPGAPEKYEFKAPDGTVLDEAVVAEFSAAAKELGLPQDAAQKVIDKLAPTIAKQNAQAITAAVERVSTEWAAATKVDKELGGDKLDENLAVAKKALERFGTPELRALLGKYDPKTNPKGTGLGNNPEIIRAFFRAGKSIREDTVVTGNAQPSKGERNAAKALYPNQA